MSIEFNDFLIALTTYYNKLLYGLNNDIRADINYWNDLRRLDSQCQNLWCALNNKFMNIVNQISAPPPIAPRIIPVRPVRQAANIPARPARQPANIPVRPARHVVFDSSDDEAVLHDEDFLN